MIRHTTISFTIYEKDAEAWGVGAELLEGGKPYHIFSLFLSKTEFPSRNRVIHYMFSVLMPCVKEEHDWVCFISTLPHFGNNFAKLRRKAGLYSGGKLVYFKETQSIRRHTVILAIDAVQIERRNSITEKL